MRELARQRDSETARQWERTARRSTATATDRQTLILILMHGCAGDHSRSPQRVCMQNWRSIAVVAALHNISRPGPDWACKSSSSLLVLTLSPVSDRCRRLSQFYNKFDWIAIAWWWRGPVLPLSFSLSLSRSLGLPVFGSRFLSFDVCTLQMIMNWFLIARSSLFCMHTYDMNIFFLFVLKFPLTIVPLQQEELSSIFV